MSVPDERALLLDDPRVCVHVSDGSWIRATASRDCSFVCEKPRSS